MRDAPPPVRLLVAIEVGFYREGVARLLAKSGAVDVVAVASSPFETLELVDRFRPDVVLLDVSLDSGLRIACEVGGRHPDVRLLPLMVDERDDTVLAWAEAGVAGFVTARTSLEGLIESIRRVALGEGVCTPRGVATLLRRVSDLSATRAADATADRLTRREIEVVYLLERGLSNKEIADRLHLSVPTVKNHVHRILTKLHLQRRGEAGAWARQARAGATLKD
jgi:two-component system nitrate/nitrite response regulator NarL